MIKSELSIEVSSTKNQKLMRLYDTSHYCDSVIDNYLIEVLPVNKSSWVTFNVAKNFSLTLNSANLRYNKVNSVTELINLPDGIYEIKQSIKPNILTVSHFYYMRTVELLNKIRAEFIKLLDEKCGITKFEYTANKNKLRDIEEYVNAAKWMVEECQDKARGKELYEFATTLLEQYTNECQC